MSPVPLKRQSLKTGTVSGSQLAAAPPLFLEDFLPSLPLPPIVKGSGMVSLPEVMDSGLTESADRITALTAPASALSIPP